MSPLLILAVIAGSLKGGYFEMITAMLPNTEYHLHSELTYWIMTIGTQVFVALAIMYAYKKYAFSPVTVPDGSNFVFT